MNREDEETLEKIMGYIMVVDDSDFVRDRLVKLLEREGYEVLAARNGVEAVEIYRNQHPDAVLMDITMPQRSGLEALTEIRDFDHDARVIMLTAIDQKLMITRAMHLGAMDYLVKPVAASHLLGVIKNVLEGPHAFAH